MKRFKNLIIGSSFFSIGFALEEKNTLIIEEGEILDTSFYLPLRGFDKYGYIPVTESGKELEQVLTDRGIISGGLQNVSAFEIGLSRFAEMKQVKVYLGCRIAEKKANGEGYSITLVHNGGLEEIIAENVIDTRKSGDGEARLAVIFDSENGELDKRMIDQVFQGSDPKEAFYRGRYVLYESVTSDNVNLAKCEIYERWKALSGYRILYIAPTFYTKSNDPNPLSDEGFDNPIEAFEHGIMTAREVGR